MQTKGKPPHHQLYLNLFIDGSVLAGASNSVYGATLKGKITGLEETCKALTEEINYYRTEIATLRDEKGELE